MAEYRWDLPWTREVCNRDPKEVWDDGLQGYDHINGIKHEAIKCASSETVDATMYRQMIGSLMYLRLDTYLHVHLMVAKHAGVQLIMDSSMM